MRPDPSTVLRGTAAAMMVDLPKDIRTPFGLSTAGTAGALNLIVAEEFDRMVDRLAEENAATAAILADAQSAVDRELSDRIAVALAEPAPANLRVSTFQALNDRLRALLVEVHAFVDGSGEPAAAELNERIWAELDASTRRREVHLAQR